MRPFLAVLLVVIAAYPAEIPEPDAVQLQAALQASLGQLDRELRRQESSGDREAGVEILRHMARLDPENPLPYVRAAWLFLEAGDATAAEPLMRTFGSTGPGLQYGHAVLEFFAEDHPAAETALRAAIEAYETRGHLAGRASSYLLLGDVLRRLRRMDEAQQALDTALPDFERLAYRDGIGMTRRYQGRLAYSRKDYPLSIERLRQSLEFFEEDRIGTRASVWTDIGRACLLADRPPEALEAYETALALRLEENKPRGIYEAYLSIGHARLAMEDPLAAIEAWRKAHEFAGRLGTADRLARIEDLIGRNYSTRVGDHDAAIEWLTRHLQTCRDGAESRIGLAHFRLGQALARAGRYSEAERELQHAVARPDSTWVRIEALGYLARIHQSTGELTQALMLQEQALGLARGNARYRSNTLPALNRLATIHYQFGDLEAARAIMEQALELAIEQDNVLARTRALTNLGVVAFDQDQTERALEHLQEALSIRDAHADARAVALVRLNAAEVLWRLERRDEAREMLALSRGAFDELDDAEGQAFAENLQAGFLASMGQAADALAAYDRAATLGREYGLRFQLAKAYVGRAAVHESAGSTAGALEDSLQAVEILDSLRSDLETVEFKMRFSSGRARVYERAVEFQAALEQDSPSAPETFRLAERARARSLLDSLTESRAALRGSVDPRLIEGEAQRVDAVRAAVFRLSEAGDGASRTRAREALAAREDALQQFKVEVRRGAPRYAEILYPEPSDLDAIRRDVLRDDETLLRYFIGEKSAMLWIVDREQARFEILPSADRLKALTAEFLEHAGQAALRLGAGGGAEREAEALAEALSIPELPPGRRLVIVPDGPLHHLPFEALRRDGQYLVEDHEIVIVPSASAFKLMRDEGASALGSGFLGVSDPASAENGPPVAPLPYSKRALEAIARDFGAEPRTLLLGERATRDNLLAQDLVRFRHVHFATHGWFEPDSPRHFRLQMTPTQPDGSDGFIYLEDVYAMRLAAELVVLQACSSGRGELLRGEGLIGLTRAFLYAGARSLLVSLWDVADRSTAEFMQVFYEELRGGQDVAAALRQAKLRFIRSDRPVQRQIYRWAPFVLVGDPPVRPAPESATAGDPTRVHRAPAEATGSESANGPRSSADQSQ